LPNLSPDERKEMIAEVSKRLGQPGLDHSSLSDAELAELVVGAHQAKPTTPDQPSLMEELGTKAGKMVSAIAPAIDTLGAYYHGKAQGNSKGYYEGDTPANLALTNKSPTAYAIGGVVGTIEEKLAENYAWNKALGPLAKGINSVSDKYLAQTGEEMPGVSSLSDAIKWSKGNAEVPTTAKLGSQELPATPSLGTMAKAAGSQFLRKSAANAPSAFLSGATDNPQSDENQSYAQPWERLAQGARQLPGALVAGGIEALGTAAPAATRVGAGKKLQPNYAEAGVAKEDVPTYLKNQDKIEARANMIKNEPENVQAELRDQKKSAFEQGGAVPEAKAKAQSDKMWTARGRTVPTNPSDAETVTYDMDSVPDEQKSPELRAHEARLQAAQGQPKPSQMQVPVSEAPPVPGTPEYAARETQIRDASLVDRAVQNKAARRSTLSAAVTGEPTPQPASATLRPMNEAKLQSQVLNPEQQNQTVSVPKELPRKFPITMRQAAELHETANSTAKSAPTAPPGGPSTPTSYGYEGNKAIASNLKKAIVSVNPEYGMALNEQAQVITNAKQMKAAKPEKYGTADTSKISTTGLRGAQNQMGVGDPENNDMWRIAESIAGKRGSPDAAGARLDITNFAKKQQMLQGVKDTAAKVAQPIGLAADNAYLGMQKYFEKAGQAGQKQEQNSSPLQGAFPDLPAMNPVPAE